MSFSTLTRNSFQSGLAPTKWIYLCQLFTSKNHHHSTPRDLLETDLSNSVLILLRHYPGDSVLQGYLKAAIQNGLLSLPTFVTTFLSAARSQELHNASTLDMLCRVAIDSHYASGMPPLGSIVSFTESTSSILGTVQDAMALLRTVNTTLQMSQFHQTTMSASELLILLLSCVTDVSQIPTSQTMSLYTDASHMLQTLPLSPDLRQMLETFVMSLSLVFGDSANAAREAQMMQTLQLAFTKGDIIGPNSDSDVITCGLLSHYIVQSRASEFGSGDGLHVAAVLVGLLRWSSWTPTIFYTQLLLSALKCMAQNVGPGAVGKTALLWRAFVVGRLPQFLLILKKIALEGTVEADWHEATKSALTSVSHQSELLHKCDSVLDTGGSSGGTSIILELVYQLQSIGMIDTDFAVTLIPTLHPNFKPRLQLEAQDAGMDLESYFESRFSADHNLDDTIAILEREWRDPCSHAALAEVVRKKFTSLTHSSDIEPLSRLCKVLCIHQPSLDAISLHVKLSDLVAHGLALLERYDCESIGDPQSAVTHLGDVVLFLQIIITRYHLSSSSFALGERSYNTDIVRVPVISYRAEDLKGDGVKAFHDWFKALFDDRSEGIEDTILRATRPRTLLRIAPTLFSRAITLCSERKMNTESLNNGISYFLGPLLNWTLVGVVQVLLTEVQQKGFSTPIHYEVLSALLLSPSCPKSVLYLSAPHILRLFSSPKALQKASISFDPASIYRAALEALGLPGKPANIANSLNNTRRTDPDEQCRKHISDAFAVARAEKAPMLDVDRCLLLVSPAQFLYTLWTELVISASVGDIEIARRIATFVLTTPRSPQYPPLLPIYLHVVVPQLLAAADHFPPPDQTMTVELLVTVISSSLTAALNLEWALLATAGEQRLVLGQSALSMARRLAADLRGNTHSSASQVVIQRLASSPPFAANFPTFMAEL